MLSDILLLLLQESVSGFMLQSGFMIQPACELDLILLENL